MLKIVSSALGPALLADRLTLAACSEAAVAAFLVASATQCIADSSSAVALVLASVMPMTPKMQPN
jgi:hypothetical protein